MKGDDAIKVKGRERNGRVDTKVDAVKPPKPRHG
jgi:hypothetical protein